MSGPELDELRRLVNLLVVLSTAQAVCLGLLALVLAFHIW